MLIQRSECGAVAASRCAGWQLRQVVILVCRVEIRVAGRLRAWAGRILMVRRPIAAAVVTHPTERHAVLVELASLVPPARRQPQRVALALLAHAARLERVRHAAPATVEERRRRLGTRRVERPPPPPVDCNGPPTSGGPRRVRRVPRARDPQLERAERPRVRRHGEVGGERASQRGGVGAPRVRVAAKAWVEHVAGQRLAAAEGVAHARVAVRVQLQQLVAIAAGHRAAPQLGREFVALRRAGVVRGDGVTQRPVGRQWRVHGHACTGVAACLLST
eukprot:2112842-Prymnesium_polylepis.1